MGIDGTKPLGEWGKFIPVSNNIHLTQTNDNSRDGKAVHITTEISGLSVKVHDRFDANGNYLGSNFAKK
jgi:hypothetical protein